MNIVATEICKSHSNRFAYGDILYMKKKEDVFQWKHSD